MSYAQTLSNALQAEGIQTTRTDGSPLSQEDLVNAFIAKHEKKGSKSSPQKPSGKESGQARKQPKVSVDASGTTKADFFAEHRDEVKKVHKSAADCRKELLRMWNEQQKKGLGLGLFKWCSFYYAWLNRTRRRRRVRRNSHTGESVNER